MVLGLALIEPVEGVAQPPQPRGRLGGPPPSFNRNGGQNRGEEKKEDGESGGKKDGKARDEKGDDDSKDPEPITRPTEPPKPPDPRELDAEPDKNGRVTFSFNGQPWADVLQWLAGVSDLSLDWRELPGDYLNLTTQRAYTLPEARDLINRHLQARGYALLLSGEVLSVFKLEELEPSLVPRITEEDLYDRQPHDIVKLSMGLPPDLDAKQAVEDVKQVMGPNAKALPLAATRRLLLIDNVANLRMVSALLNSERLAAEGRELPREFFLEYVQASAVIDILYVVLGLDPQSRPSQMELRMQQQKLELMQQLARSGKDVTQMLQKDGPPVYLAYNRQRNSVLANAPPAEMRVIARAIESLDVPSDDGLGSGDPSDRKLEQYRLKTIDPQAVIDTLSEIGNISPRAELRGDNESKTLFARATRADHEKIAELIDRIDGSGTVVDVFWLRKLPAEAVAGSIRALLIEEPKGDNDRRGYDPWDWRWRGRDDDEQPKTLLRVDADVENNRLIARGTPQQMQEIRDLLTKLGEPPQDAVANRRVRVFDALGPQKTARLLRQIEQAWPAIGGETELVLPPEDDRPRAGDPERGEEESNPSRQTTASPVGDHVRLLYVSDSTGEAPTRATEGGQSEPTQPDSGRSRSKVSVQTDAAGRLVAASDDPAALARLENLVEQLAPPPERYRMFKVTNRSPDDIVFSLETYFTEFLAEDDDGFSDYYRWLSGEVEDETVRLSRRVPLRFLADDWSSTILVANATAAQLAEIERLIDAWDREPIGDRVVVRKTRTVPLQYAKASTVVDAVKSVYREMLSRADKEFDTPERRGANASTRYLTKLDTMGGASEPAFIGFDGLLSIGADDDANVVVVSAREEVFESVVETILELDRRAKPTTTVRVVPIAGGVDADELRRTLLRVLAADGDSGGSSSSRSRSRDSSNRRRYRRR